MRATLIHGPRDVRLEQVPDPRVELPTDAVVRVVAACVCGSDLWPYRGVAPTPEPRRIGHEFVGIVEEVGAAVATVRPGDFVVARAPADDVLEVVLVDVSGKGQAVGVRSLQLSGALAGLLGAMAPADFLPAANSYLLGQGWDDGFATAAHLALDLRTGAYQVSTAGHLPPVQLHAGSGRVSVVDTVGAPVLGVTPDFRCQARTGTLQPGDALLLYTDGLVETRGGDLDQGIDRLLGVLEQLVSTGRGGADAVLAAARRQEDDDRALVLVQRA